MADSIREALTAAMDAAPAEPVTPDVTASANSAPVEPAKEPAKDAVSGSAVGDAKVVSKAPNVVGAPDTRAPTEPAKPAEPVAKVNTPDPAGPQAPGSWTAEEKASWSNLPRAAQNAVLRRERDASRAVNQASEAKKAAEEYTRALEPFQPLFESRKVAPAQAVREVMGMSAILLTGSKEQKAALVANIIKAQNVDIELLDSIIAGEVQPQQHVEGPPPAWAQKLMQLSQRLDETQRERDERMATEAASAIDAAASDVAKFPHFERVREHIADVLELAAKRGVEMTLEQAYDRAVAWDPELREIEAQKAKASSVSDAARTLAASRKAATSVAGAPNVGASAKPATIRDALVAAMDGR